jgi:flagellar motor switch protein FliN/FliY
LRDSPLGSLDVAQAVRPALEAAASTLGPVVVDPGRIAEPEEALSALIAGGGAAVPLTDGTDVRAVVGLSVASVTTHVIPTTPADQPRAEFTPGRAGLEILHDVEMEVTAELGRTRMSVKELLSLVPGAVIELDRAAGGPADLLVNGRLLARGEVVVIDENFGIRITEIVAPTGERS